MLVIADNLSVRNKAYMDAVKKKDKKAIEAMAKELAAKGADMVNVQVSLDGSATRTPSPWRPRPCSWAAAFPSASIRGT